MAAYEKQAIETRYNAIESSLPAPNLQNAANECKRQRKPTPLHRWVAVGLFLVTYFWLNSPAGSDALGRLSHRFGQPCQHSAPHFGAGLKPENETDFSQAARGEVVWFDCNDEKRYPAPLQCGRMKAPLDWTNADDDSRNASIAVIFYPAGAGATPRIRCSARCSPTLVVPEARASSSSRARMPPRTTSCSPPTLTR